MNNFPELVSLEKSKIVKILCSNNPSIAKPSVQEWKNRMHWMETCFLSIPSGEQYFSFPCCNAINWTTLLNLDSISLSFQRREHAWGTAPEKSRRPTHKLVCAQIKRQECTSDEGRNGIMKLLWRSQEFHALSSHARDCVGCVFARIKAVSRRTVMDYSECINCLSVSSESAKWLTPMPRTLFENKCFRRSPKRVINMHIVVTPCRTIRRNKGYVY